MNFTITTPLYYVNDSPHLGSTYTTIAADTISRFMRLEGKSVNFITGVDEHGQKIERTANSRNLTPQGHCDKTTLMYKKLWSKLNISNNKFVRTTSNSHISFVHSFYNKVKASGDIRLGRQQGWYCVGCEEYKEISSDNDSEHICNIHLNKLEWRDEENLFFKLSSYQKEIEEIVKSDSFIYPKKRRNEVIKFVERGLKDFSISRINVPWGIYVPDMPGHTFYVWFDALLGYLSVLNESTNGEPINGWPADYHFIGKDILRFHAVYWPAMLISADLPLPKSIFGHGFLTREGKKMGKSLGNILEPNELIDNYGEDSVRWYLLKDIRFGDDGDFQQKRFIDLVNNDLANTIGNLLNRTSSMSRKWFNNSVPDFDPNDIIDDSLKLKCTNSVDSFIKSLYSIDFQKSCEIVLDLAEFANLYLNDKAPWKNIKIEDEYYHVGEQIYNVLETCRIIGVLLTPILPKLSNRMIQQLNYELSSIPNWHSELKWGKLAPKKELPLPEPIFSKLEVNELPGK